MNPYKILNLKPGATDKEITKSYRSLALLYHPDKRKSSTTSTAVAADEEMFQLCKDAYQQLMDPKQRAEIDLKLAGEEERKRRLESMSEHRKELQRDLLERERAFSLNHPKSTNNTFSDASQSTTTTTTTTTVITKFVKPKKPEYALLLKVKNTGPLPLTPVTLSASLNLPVEAIQIDHQQILAEFNNPQQAAEVLAKLPFDSFRSGDWFLGYPPAELFKESINNFPAEPEEKRPKITKEFESDVLKRLREAANKKKQ